MNDDSSEPEISRREFLGKTTRTVGVAGLSATALAAAKAEVSRKNPYFYDVERLRAVDAKLVHFERTTKFSVGQADPRRIAITAEKRLLVAAGRKVVSFDLSGNPLSEFTVGGEARSLCAAGDGTVFIGVRDHVEIFDAKGKPLAAWPKLSGKPLITGIAVGEKDVFLADAGNRIVWRCDRSGKLIRRIGEKDAQRNILGFVVPSPFFDLALGADGLLRVGNPGRHRVETYTPDGDLEFAWGKAGAGIEGFCGCCNPINLDLLPDGRVVTFEKGLARVKIYSATGVLESVVAAPSSFADALRDACESADCSFGGLDGVVEIEGRVHVLDLIMGAVQTFARKTGVTPGAVPGAAPGGAAQATG